MKKSYFAKFVVFVSVSALTWFCITRIRAITNRSSSDLPTLTSSKLQIDFLEGSKLSKTVQTTIMNNSSFPIYIDKIVTSCSCTQTSNNSGTEIPAGSSKTIDFAVDSPGYGVKNVSASIYIKNINIPLLVDIQSRAPFTKPIVIRKVNENPVFFGLSDLNRPASVQIITRENTSSAPWLQNFQSDLDGLAIVVETAVQLSDSQIDTGMRRYELKFKWDKIPSAQNFSGKYFAIDSLSHSTINLGKVSGSTNQN